MPAVSLVGAILLWQVPSEAKAEDVQRVVSSLVGILQDTWIKGPHASSTGMAFKGYRNPCETKG